MALGKHIEIPFSIQVPKLTEGFVDYIDMELITRKKGEIKFKDTKRYTLRSGGYSGQISSLIILHDPI